MPRRLKQRKGKTSCSVAGHQADFKLGDFADNPAAKLPSRMSKKTYQIKYDKTDMRGETTSQVKSKLTTREADSKVEEKKEKKMIEEDLAWDERDWDEKDLLDFETNVGCSTRQRFDDEDDEEVAEEEDVVSQRGKKASKKNTKKDPQPAHEGTREYPTDLWYVLADYIRPEDIATFSCLCKAAYSITRTVSFWKKLYSRYLNSSTALPAYLQLGGKKHTRGLRAFVIRALYFLHEPYRLALNVTSPVGEGRSSPEAITDFTCLYTWSYGKLGHHCTHFMKLRLCNTEGAVPHIGACYDPSVFANDNRWECILRVHCEHFQDVPSAKIMGLQLVRSSVSVSANMRHHRVKLEFGRKGRRGLYVKSSIITVFLDPVLKVDVLHWWHPQFRESSQRSIDKAVAENAANLRENNVWEGL